MWIDLQATPVMKSVCDSYSLLQIPGLNLSLDELGDSFKIANLKKYIKIYI